MAFPTPFGTLYSTNITADKETGIGDYSDEDFLNAVRRGIRRDGARLYPAMPFSSYAYMTDADVLAIKAYLFSLPPVRTANRADTLSFPFNQRWSMVFWSLLFVSNSRFAPNTMQSPEWNRGAYLAEALAHCGECHTPRNVAFALDHRQKFAGAVVAGWRAFNITSDKGSADIVGKRLFAGACVGCHDWTGVSAITPFATIAGTRAVNDRTAVNVAQIVISGTMRSTPRGVLSMPAFGGTYSDVEIAAVANYVTGRFGSEQSKITAKDVAQLRNQTSR